MKKYLVIFLCLTAIVSGGNRKYLRPRPSSKGLVAHYKLWGSPMFWATPGIDGKVFDYSLNGYVGTLIDTSDPNNLLPAYPGFIFDGSDDYIDIGTGPNPTKTISLWIKQDDISGNEYPIDLNGTDYLAIESGTLNVYGLAGHTLYVDSVVGTDESTSISALVWTHIVITDSTANDASDFDIGRKDTGYYDGLIGGVRLYSKVLTAIEVRDLYETTRWRYSK